MKHLGHALLALAASQFLAVGAAQAETLRLLSSFSQADAPTYALIVTFKENLEKITDGRMTVEISGPEVVPPLEQLQPVSAGVFDMLYTHGAYHAGSRGLAVAVDNFLPKPDLMRESGVFDYIDKYYQEQHNLKIVALNAHGVHGYQCYLRDEPKDQNDWSGLKLRGAVSFHGVIESMGAAPVSMPLGEVYSALERGVVDGACMGSIGLVANKHYEIAPYRVEPTFGNTRAFFSMNLDRWNSLSEQDQADVLKAGLKTEYDNIEKGIVDLEIERAKLKELGAKVITLSKERGEKNQKAFVDHVWKLANDCCGEAAREMRELGAKAGLTQ